MDEINKIKEAIKKISLSGEEKEALLGKVAAYVRETPIGERPVAESYALYFALTKTAASKKYVQVFAVVLFFILCGGVSLAANSALPGDFLYPIKVNVNEQIETMFAFGTVAEAQVAARHADERLSEAEKLVVKGKIEASAKAKIKTNFKNRAEHVSRLLTKMRQEKGAEAAARASSQFEGSLRAHHSILAKLAEDNEDEKEDINEIQSEVNEHLSALVETRAASEVEVAGKSDVKSAAKNSLAKAEEDIARVVILLNANLDLETQTEADAKLSEAKEALLKGRAKLDAEFYAEAFVIFQESSRKAEEAELWLLSREELEAESEDGSKDAEQEETEKEEDKSTDQPPEEIQIETKADINL